VEGITEGMITMKNKSVSCDVIFATASVVSLFIAAVIVVSLACGSDKKIFLIILAVSLALVGLKEVTTLKKALKVSQKG